MNKEIKLKTLKDMQTQLNVANKHNIGPICIPRELRHIANDWVEKLASDMNVDAAEIKNCHINDAGIFQYEFEGAFGINPHEDVAKGMIAFVKFFFNLEENNESSTAE